MSKRIEGIDICKGILIILVVIGHVISSYRLAGIYKESVSYSLISTTIYIFYMPAFMFLSGILFKQSDKKKVKSARILLNYGIPYIFFSLLWCGFKFMLSAFVNTTLKVQDILLIPIVPISFMWFIYALLIMELIQTLIGELNNRTKAIMIVAGLCLYALQYMLADVAIFDTGYYFKDIIVSDFMRMYFSFLLGQYCGKSIMAFVSAHLTVIFAGGGYADNAA